MNSNTGMFRKTYEFIKKHKEKALFGAAMTGGIYAYNNSDTVKNTVDQGWNWLLNKSPLSSILPGLPLTTPEDPQTLAESKTTTFRNASTSLSANKLRCPTETGSNNDSVTATAMQLLELALKMIDEQLDSDALRQEISKNAPNKGELWEEMKVLAWSRCFVSLYTVAHLIVYIKVQTGVAGRFLYSEKAESERDLHRKLHLMSKHVQSAEYPVREGLTDLIKVIKKAVAKAVVARPLQETLSMDDVKQVVYQVRKLVETGSGANGYLRPRNYHLEFLIPADQLEPDNLRERVVESLDERCLLDLSVDVHSALKSVDCSMVLGCCLELCFSRLFSETEMFIRDRTVASSSSSSEQWRLPHAALLPVISRISNYFVKPLDAEPLVKQLVAISYFGAFVDRIVQNTLQTDSFSVHL